MKKLFPFSFLFLLTLLFTSCDSDADKEEVLPAQESTLERSFNYVYQQPQSYIGEAYSANSVQAYISNDNEHFGASFGVSGHAEGRDNISFIIKSDELLNNYVGVYSLKSLPEPESGKAYVNFSYRRDYSSYSLLFSDGNTMEGEFRITDYDAKRNLISGSYQLAVKEAFDPTVDSFHQTDVRRCDVYVQGTFKNVPIQK